MSAATFVELRAVLEAKLHPAGAGIASRFVDDGGIDVVAFEQSQADRALEGWRRYSKGRHPAALNLGDCFTYGLGWPSITQCVAWATTSPEPTSRSSPSSASAVSGASRGGG